MADAKVAKLLAHWGEYVDEITRLRAENERLRKALEEVNPFIVYQAHVPDIVARFRALVEEVTDA